MKKTIIPVLFCVGIFAGAQEKKKPDSAAVAKEIQTVVLEGKKKLIERKVDRTVFNVENSVAVQGGDAMDALKVTPGVKINGDDIKLTGKSTVKVMVNDKIVQLSGEDLQNYLKSIPTANILKIEVITNPPAKYEAEGNSGLINIQLKEAKQYNWSATLRSSYQQGFYARFSEGASFSYRKNKFSALADIGYTFGHSLYQNEINYYYHNEHWQNYIFSKNIFRVPATTVNLNYDLTEKTSIGAQFIGSFRDGYGYEYNDNYSHAYTDNSLLKYYDTDGSKDGKANNVSLNLNLNHKIDDKGKKYSIDADYFEARSPRISDFTSDLNDYFANTLDRQFADNSSFQGVKNYSLKTDFELPYDWAQLSFGAKVSSTKTKNLVETDFYQLPANTLISAQTNHFEYTENNEALYISATKSFGKKWEAKVGLRGEYTQTKANSISLNQETNRNYFKLFPTAYLSFKPNDNHTISVNYGRRIGRPGFQSMDPARWYDSPKSYVTGNPFLQPVFTDMFEVNYNFKSLISLNLYHYPSKDNISQMSYHDIPNESVVMRHENYADGNGTGGTLSINYNPFKWWESSTDISANYDEINPYLSIFTAKKYSGWGGTTSMNNTFTLNKKKNFFASLNYWYSFPSLSWGLSDASSSLDIGFKYLALDKKLTIGLNFNDIFKTSQSMYTDFSQGFIQTFHQYYDSRNARLSLSYKFGNSKISVKQHEEGNAEEKRRAN